MNLYGSLIVYSTYIYRALLSSKSIFTPKNGNGNISYVGILKHRKYRRCDFFVLFFIDHESWRGHCPWIFFIQNHFTFSVIIIYYLMFSWFFLMWSSWRQFFSIQSFYVLFLREHGPQEQDHLGLLLGLSLPTWNVLENQLGLLPDSSVKLNFQVKCITLILIYRGWEWGIMGNDSW